MNLKSIFAVFNFWLFIGILLFLISGTNRVYAAPDKAQWLAKAQASQLWTRSEWLTLGHYYKPVYQTAWISAVDDPAFFIAQDGKQSPQNELEATLNALLTPEKDDDNAVSCRFPARRDWIIKTLGIPAHELPAYRCDKLEQWLKNLTADSISLIFPVSTFNSPASLFGHTFLRFNSEQPELSALTVNYAAHTNKERGPGFAFKGLFGGYPGNFSLAPYYVRVKEYSDLESRDIWEYRLAFSQSEIRNLQWHLWELLPVYFDYYFIDENCAYQLLALIQSARPSLQLTEGFKWDAIPADTIRGLTAIPGLITAIQYRPSARKRLLAKTGLIDPGALNLARKLTLDEITVDDYRIIRLDAKTQAQVLELAYDYGLLLMAGDKNQAQVESREPAVDEQSHLHELLKARSRLPAGSRLPSIKPPALRPDQGHLPHRLSLRYGYEEPRQYIESEFRWAYHDFYDPAGGFESGSQLQFIKPAIRYYPTKQSWDLESLQIVDIVSAPAYDDLIRPFSWKLSANLNRRRFEDNSRPLLASFSAGIGLSFAVGQSSRISLFADADASFSDHFNQFTALGGGGEVLWLTHINDYWLIGISASAINYFQGITQTTYQFGFKQRLTLDANQALVMEVAKTREFGSDFLKTSLSWQYYF